ncbi:MAG: SDR family oxidoreductase [Phycisphaeraceae bacterium]|nr:SDR family oxidoreductase [Phycisphaeraceae bacterium]
MAKTYLITGVSRGLGLELASQLSARGERVIGTVRNPGQAPGPARQACARLVPLEVSSEASILSLAAALGDEKVDVLINNAGVSSEEKSLAEITAQEMLRVLMINTVAPLLITRAMGERMAESTVKKIVNISSELGSIAGCRAGFSYAYRASKAALNMVSAQLACELGAAHYTVVSLHPGWVQTDMGGPMAPLTSVQSAGAMIRVIDSLVPADNGKFLSFDGSVLPW